VEHVVFFPAPDGSAAFRRTSTLEDAVRLVEHLRNVEGVAEVSVHPLGAEVPLAFRAWYRVELPGAPVAPPSEDDAARVEAPQDARDAVPAQEPASEPVHEPAPEPAPEPVHEPAYEPVHEPVAVGADAAPVNGHVADARSLGFFAT
jgi:hypothetical protein